MTPMFLTLADAAKYIPGADADTLKRMARAGKLTVYRPGKAFVTTHADVMKAVTEQCRVVPKVRDSGFAPPAETPAEHSPTPPLGLSSTELANMRLDLALTQPSGKKTKR